MNLRKRLVTPKLTARLIDLGGVPTPMTPRRPWQVHRRGTEKWGKVVKFAGDKPD
jgi:hypothetical protein